MSMLSTNKAVAVAESVVTKYLKVSGGIEAGAVQASGEVSAASF